jgi:phosphonate degradation associated HDIG domain protein
MSHEIDALFDLLRASATRPYIGEPVSQLEHALQAARAASEAHASEALIASALLHDIGHICASSDAREMPGLGVVDHESIGAAYLRAVGFGDDVVAPIRAHVRAKRYLVAKHRAYRERLSAASTGTLALQGGPMTEREMTAFENEPGFSDALRLRAWDDQAKVVGREVPPLEAFRSLLERLRIKEP